MPVLKTSGHYAALVTIAFVLLFKTFLGVNDIVGDPQGFKSGWLGLLGWRFSDDWTLLGLDMSLYLAYIAVILLLAMDAVRLDEVSAACFDLSIPLWKITAFTIGNFCCGVAEVFFAMMLGYIVPSNFSFGDSWFSCLRHHPGRTGFALGLVGGYGHRNYAAGEVPGAPGVPLSALRRPGVIVILLFLP